MNDLKDDLYDVADWVSDSKLLASDSRAVDVQTSTLSSYYVMGVDVSGFNEVSSFCRDLLQGCYKDYVFYRLSGSNSVTYSLFIGDSVQISDEGNWFVTSSSEDNPVLMYGFTVDYDVIDHNLSRGSGTYRLPDFVDGNTLPTYKPYIFYYNRYHEDVSLSIYYQKEEIDTVVSLDDLDNLSSVIYSSLDGYPHLIEGGQNYAYAGFLVCGAVIAFSLADRLFRRLH